MDKSLRSAAARAAHEGTTLLVIQRDMVFMLFETDPHLGYRFTHNYVAGQAMKISNTGLQIRDELLNKNQ